MIAALDRFTDDEILVPDGSAAAGLRAFYATWRSGVPLAEQRILVNSDGPALRPGLAPAFPFQA